MKKNGGLKEKKEMNNLRTYKEFVNEGFYDFMNKRFNREDWEVVLGFAFVTLITWAFTALAYYTGEDRWGVGSTIFFILSVIGEMPLIISALREFSRDFYHKLRAVLLLKKASTEYKKAEALLEKYPDIAERMDEIKLNMMEGIKDRNRRKTSEAIHEIYKLSQELKEREDADIFFEIDEEDREKLKKRGEVRKEKEKIRKMSDPYNEEDWTDETNESHFKNDWESWIDSVPDEKIGEYIGNSPIQVNQRVYHKKGGYGEFKGKFGEYSFVHFDKIADRKFIIENRDLSKRYDCENEYSGLVLTKELKKIL